MSIENVGLLLEFKPVHVEVTPLMVLDWFDTDDGAKPAFDLILVPVTVYVYPVL